MTPELLGQVLLALAVVVAAAQLGGALFRALRQPAVVGEIVAGIALGPSLLGALAPGVLDALVPPGTRPFLQLVAQLGLVVFMLLVGLEVDLGQVRRRGRLVGTVAASSIAVPFALGTVLALALHGAHDRTDAGPVALAPFVAFLGTALAVTAFPVLARILRDRGLVGTGLGGLALACAAVTDVVAWLALAVAVSLAGAATDSPAAVLGGLVAITAGMLGVVRPLLARATARGLLDRLSPRTAVSVTLLAAVLSAWCTHEMGLHSVFGPFLLGLALPRHAVTVERLEVRLADLSATLLLPAFFVVTGLTVDLTTLGASGLATLALVLAVAVAGKVAGTTLPALWCGLPRPEALGLGILLNTRGLTELVVLQVGLSAGILDARLHAVLVATAVLTTVLTGPLLALVPLAPPAAPAADAVPARPGPAPEPAPRPTPSERTPA
ncbi:cation:proton antiporter [Quadrisphaera sp. DSM 44207]|uniref:cation:proton antiporter domain-containing protein n=1 Tax=Quadrisphaera sp. DSM 44207 TaxID=1881057 RepID=UPI00088376EA|nr:cation:proton antiporter [Quadrisphaera sp. DSM 44207]SDQ22266.1 Kef-type K+ transport system, membrane component KefB [Quadrisphaera sp. DSM 44207]